jgi:hypothetical protein
MMVALNAGYSEVWDTEARYFDPDEAQIPDRMRSGRDLEEVILDVLRSLDQYYLPASRRTESIAERFDRLAEMWRVDSAFQSSIQQIAMHPAYQEIIGMGSEGVPLILKRKRQVS